MDLIKLYDAKRDGLPKKLVDVLISTDPNGWSFRKGFKFSDPPAFYVYGGEMPWTLIPEKDITYWIYWENPDDKETA